jgi:N-acetylmannosamine-6-phosphate 2-epimerase / N-acetylmannosamine kinase
MNVTELSRKLQGKLIVSCQASEGDAFRDSESMARFAKAALDGGAAGIRANGVDDIRSIRRVTTVPILAIEKVVMDDGNILITPSMEAARRLVEAGADIVGVDCTVRGQRYGALERVRQISELGVPVAADIATVEEAVAAVQAGAAFVLSTMRGHTAETAHVTRFDPEFIGQLVKVCPVPVIAEGRINTPEEASEALAAGALAVVVGTAITRPHDITRKFATAIEKAANPDCRRVFLGIDLGGTNTKFGIISARGQVLYQEFVPTPAKAGREVLLGHLKRVAQAALQRANEMSLPAAALGIATAGWVDAETGQIAYATDNLPGWTGTPVGEEVAGAVHLPVAVENDANALAVAEKHFGAGRGLQDFVCITFGTGVGGGAYIGGKLNRGAHFFANAFGHMVLEPNGVPCNCGQRGCFEVYCNATALIRYAGNNGETAEQVITAAHAGDAGSASAVLTFARYVAQGCASLVQLLDPEALIFAGGLVQNNSMLLEAVPQELAQLVPTWSLRRMQVLASPLGYYGGVLGAAAVAMEKLC